MFGGEKKSPWFWLFYGGSGMLWSQIRQSLFAPMHLQAAAGNAGAGSGDKHERPPIVSPDKGEPLDFDHMALHTIVGPELTDFHDPQKAAELSQVNFECSTVSTNLPESAINAAYEQGELTEAQLSYIPLHVHSDYSIRDGLESVEAIAKQAAKLKIPAIALTDWTNICGYIKFYTACKNNGIKPIMGADLVVEEPWAANLTGGSNSEENRTFRVTVLAMDHIGKQNLYDLLSNAWLRSDAGAFNATTKLSELAYYNKGLILLNGFRGDIARLAADHQDKLLAERLQFYLHYYGDRFCFEITRTNREGESSFENTALNLCMQYHIAPVATNDTCFLYGENSIGEDGISDYQVHDVRVSIQNGCLRGSKEMARLYSKEQYLKTPQEMRILFNDLPEAIINTRMIAERCTVELELDKPRLPRYDTGSLTSAECLREEAHKGLEQRLAFLYPDPKVREEQRPRYIKRLETELDVIIKMDFPGYFLIVMEFIQWSKDHGVPVGPGRGSGGGSLVAYALKITDFDPMAFDLLFERFLNPERVSMPDFDVDFCQRNREKTLEHVKQNYGLNSVSQIAAFGTMAPKAAIKDVGRALGMTYGSVDYVAKLLPTMPNLTFQAAMGFDKKGNPCDSVAPDFLNLYNQAKSNDDKARIELIHYAMRLEGVIKIIGKHAAGVVISPTRTAEFSPLMLDSDGNPITQFDKKDVEHAGLVKFDFLGLTTLTIIQDALDMINARKKRLNQPLVDVHAIPYDDPESFAVLQQGETTAVFQLESDGMRKLIGQMKPDRFDDMIALVALYRPGPIKSGMVDHFVKRKHGEEEVCYPAPDFQDLDLKPILDSTYGVIVYQEQVMQIAQVLAGYSLGGADILRRAMGKKNPAEMAGQRSVFKEGAAKKGKDTTIAMKIFDQVEMFAEYGFNKSHSAAYALVAWWTLYLKVHYPAEFLAAMMTADRQRTEKLVSYIAECYRLGIKVNPPDVNVGKFDFTVADDGSIIYGLGAIKGIGEELVEQIVATREQEKGFNSFFDFVAKVGTQRLNKKSIEALIYSGALDSLGASRALMHANLTKAQDYATQVNEDQATGQGDLFAAFDELEESTDPEFTPCAPWPEKYRLNQEKQMLGLYLSGHPINAYRQELKAYCTNTLNKLHPGSYDRPSVDTVAGVVIHINDRVSKKDGKKFYIITIDDSTSQLTLPLYGSQADDFGRILAERDEAQEQRKQSAPVDMDPSMLCPAPLIVISTIKIFNAEEGTRVRVQNIETLETKRRQKARSITISLSKNMYEQHHELINKLVLRNLLSVQRITQELQQKGLPPRSQLPNPPAPSNISSSRIHNQNQFERSTEVNVDEGCTLSIMIDNIRLKLANLTYRIQPSDDLIEGIRDLAGPDSIAIGY